MLVELLDRHQVAGRLAHRARVVAGAAVALADHAVLDHVAVLVADHARVEVAVDAGRVERAGDRLPQVHVRDRRTSRRAASTCSRCCAPPRRRPGGAAAAPACELPRTGVVLAVRLGQPEVRGLRVPVVLGEAERVRPVVHPVVLDEQVRRGRRDVEALAGHEGGAERRARVAVGRAPGVRPREAVVARPRWPAGTASAPGWLPSVHDSALRALLPTRRVRRRVELRVEVPRRAGRQVADHVVAVARASRSPSSTIRARVSVLGLSHGSASSALCGGVPPNTSQRAVYGLRRRARVERDRAGVRARLGRRGAVAELADLRRSSRPARRRSRARSGSARACGPCRPAPRASCRGTACRTMSCAGVDASASTSIARTPAPSATVYGPLSTSQPPSGGRQLAGERLRARARPSAAWSTTLSRARIAPLRAST